MASLISPEVFIDYSIFDGRIRELKMFGEVLVDENVSADGWRERLWDWAEENNLLLGDRRRGWRAWAIRLAKELNRELPTRQ